MNFADDAEWRRLDRKVTAASEARFRLPPGSSRARVTTANARWAKADDYEDLCLDLEHLQDRVKSLQNTIQKRGLDDA